MRYAANPCEYPEYLQSGLVKVVNRPEKTHKGDVSKVSNVSKYSRNSRNSQQYSHPKNRIYNTSKQEIIGHSQYSHCFRELLTSKVIF
jgi:hypothetical protein